MLTPLVTIDLNNINNDKMKTEEIFKQSGYTIPTDKHDECTKRFDYWDMIAFADLVTEKLKERDSNLALHLVSHCNKCKQPLKGEKVSSVGYNICTCNWDTSNCG